MPVPFALRVRSSMRLPSIVSGTRARSGARAVTQACCYPRVVGFRDESEARRVRIESLERALAETQRTLDAVRDELDAERRPGSS